MFALLLAIFCASVGAQSGAANPPGKIPDAQLYGFIDKDSVPPGTVPWQLLRQVKLVEARQKGAKAAAMVPEFAAQVKSSTTVKSRFTASSCRSPPARNKNIS